MAKTRTSDQFKYYSYVLIYVDDILCIDEDATSVLKELDKYFMMKPGSIGDPDLYLGAKLRKVQLNNGVFAWAFSASIYAHEAVRNVERFLDSMKTGRKLPKRAAAPFPCNYTPELDTTPELEPTEATYF